MTLTASLRSQDELGLAIAEEMACPISQDGLRRALAAEHLRTAVFTASQTSDHLEPQLIHTTRLLGTVRSALAGLWHHERDPGANPDDWRRRALIDLAELGDVEAVSGGYWLATPLRFIEFKGSENLLILGSAPSHLIRSEIGVMPICSGVGRLVPHSALRPSAPHLGLVVSSDAWFGPEQPLAAWTKLVIGAYARRLSAPEEIDADQLEVYAPDIMRLHRRPTPWVPAAEVNRALTDPRICRPLASRIKKWDRPYYLGIFSFKDGNLRLRQSALLSEETSARLRYGIDLALKAPRVASILVKRDSVTLDMRFRLPSPESKIKCLSWEDGEQGQAHSLSTFHSSTLPIIRAALDRLSIKQNLTEGDRHDARRH